MLRDYTVSYKVDTSTLGASQAAIQAFWAAMEAGQKRASAETSQLTFAVKDASRAMGELGVGAAGLGKVEDAAKKTGQSFLGMTAHTVAASAAFLGMEAGLNVLMELATAAQKLRDKMKEMADEASKLRGEYREYANLIGKDAPDNQAMAKGMSFGLDTGMTPRDAVKFLEQYEGSSPAGIEKGNLGDGRRQGESLDAYRERTKPLQDEIAKIGARFAQQKGITASTAGDLTGVLSQYGKIASGEDAARQLGQIAYGLNAGRGNLEPLIQTLGKTAGSIVDEGMGPVKDLNELGVMLGVMSTHHGGRRNVSQSGTYLLEAVRGLRGFTSSQAGTLNEMKITQDDSAIASMRKASDWLKDQEKKGVAPDVALMQGGFNESRSRSAIIELHKDRAMWESRLTESQTIGAKQVLASNEHFWQSQEGENLRLRAADEASKIAKGMEHEPMRNAVLAATIRMRDAGTLTSQQQMIADKIGEAGGITTGVLGMAPEFEKRIYDEAASATIREAENRGLGDAAGEWDKLNKDNPNEVSSYFRKYRSRISAAGGDATGGTGGVKIKLQDEARDRAVKKEWDKHRGDKNGNALVNTPGANRNDWKEWVNPLAWVAWGDDEILTPAWRKVLGQPEDSRFFQKRRMNDRYGPPIGMKSEKIHDETEPGQDGAPKGPAGQVAVPNNAAKAKAAASDENGLFPVAEVVDGDTIKVRKDGKLVTVRMVGVDTPEVKDPRKPAQPFGAEASKHTHELLDGKKVRLKPNPDGDRQDKYGRTLAYVEREDGLNVNKDLIEGGFAEVMEHFPFDRMKEFLGLQGKAKAEGKGKWQGGDKHNDGTPYKKKEAEGDAKVSSINVGGADDLATTNQLLAELIQVNREQLDRLEGDGTSPPPEGGVPYGPKRA